MPRPLIGTSVSRAIPGLGFAATDLNLLERREGEARDRDSAAVRADKIITPSIHVDFL